MTRPQVVTPDTQIDLFRYLCYHAALSNFQNILQIEGLCLNMNHWSVPLYKPATYVVLKQRLRTAFQISVPEKSLKTAYDGAQISLQILLMLNEFQIQKPRVQFLNTQDGHIQNWWRVVTTGGFQ